MKYGYVRVSTNYEQTKERNQKFDRQIMILKEHGVTEENIFEERISGGVSTKDRPEFDKLMKTLVAGDMIVVSEMSRFSRSLQDLIETVNHLVDRKIGITFIKENIVVDDNGFNPMNKLIFQLFGAFAEFEKSLIAERVRAGMQASKEKGVKLGRSTKLTAKQEQEFIADYNENMPYTEMQAKYNLSKPSVISTANRLGLAKRYNKK